MPDGRGEALTESDAVREERRLGARTPLTPAEARVHRAIWRHLLASARRLDARRLAAPLRVTPAWAARLLARLAAKDYVVLARPGPIVAAAYPLSASRTRHRADIGWGRTVYAL
jgi:predicted transcriptional regulator